MFRFNSGFSSGIRPSPVGSHDLIQSVIGLLRYWYVVFAARVAVGLIGSGGFGQRVCFY